METLLTVHTLDNHEMKIDSRITNLSRLLKDISENGDDIIPVQVPHDVLEKIIEFCNIHDYQPIRVEKPIKSRHLQDNLNEKDYKFIKNYNLETMKPLLDAAYYLGIESLRDVCICLIATDFYIGTTVEDIYKIKEKFGITTNITPEEEEEIKKEYPWALEDEIADGIIESDKQEITMIEEESKS